MTVEKAVHQYLEHCCIEKNLSPKTIEAYTTDLNQFKHFLIRSKINRIQEVDRNLLRQFCAQLDRYKPRTIKRKVACLKAMFNFLEFDDIIESNPFRKMWLQLKTPKYLPEVMSLVEVKKVLQAAYNYRLTISNNRSYAYKEATRNIAVLEFLFATGVRVSEMCALRSSSIDLDSGAVRIVGKGSKERLITIVDREAIEVLKEYRSLFSDQIHTTQYFFNNRFGKPISDQSVRYLIQKYVDLAKIDKHITPHTFRHTFATLLLESDVDIKYIQHFLGHSSIMTTQIYTHVNQEKQQQILNAKHPRLSFKMTDLVT